MILTIKVKLNASAEQREILLSTMEAFNLACNYISETAYKLRVFNRVRLHKECYYSVRDKFGLSAQMTTRAICKVEASYKAERKHMHTFNKKGSVVYDNKVLSFKKGDNISVFSLSGRLLIPLVTSKYYKNFINEHTIKNQYQLLYTDGELYLKLSVDKPKSELQLFVDVIGFDLGIANILADSTGESFSGKTLNALRYRHARLRSKLQAKRTKSAKRLLKKRKFKEMRYANDVNHKISKKVVEKALRHRSIIALEDLTGIKDRVTVKKVQRRQHHSWSFYHLRKLIEYKAELYGVPVVFVNPRNTSRTCPECGLIDKKNRVSRDRFHCQCCGYAAPADNVAARNIASRAAVTQPYAVG